MSTWELAAIAAGLILAASPVAARPFTVDDLLREQSFGEAAADPAGRWLVIERRDPYDSLPVYRYGGQTGLALSRLLVVDLERPGPARPLLPEAFGRGVRIAAFSPDGARLAVLRLNNEGLTLGVVELSTREVRWFPVTPETTEPGRTLQWTTATELLVLDRGAGDLPRDLGVAQASAERLPMRWAETAAGRASVTLLGSGAYGGVRPHAPPRRLVRIDMRTGDIAVIASGAFTDLEAAPDGRRVALLEAGPDIQPSGDGPVQGAAGLQTQRSRLVLLDRGSGRLSRPTGDADLLPHLLSWSPRSDALLVFARRPGASWSTGEFRRVDVLSERAEVLGAGLAPELRLRPEIVRAGWLGPSPIALARRPGAARADWYRLDAGRPINLTAAVPGSNLDLLTAGDGGIMVVADHALWQVTRGGNAERVARGATRAGRPPTRTAVRLDVALPREAALLIDRALWRARGTRLTRVLDQTTDANTLAVVDRGALLDRRSPGGPWTLELVLKSRAPVPVATINTGLMQADEPRLAEVRHPGPDGETLTSWLFLPLAAETPPPLVIQPYAGAAWPRRPDDTVRNTVSMLSPRVLVGHGYAVLVPSLPTPRGGEPMSGLAARILRVVDAAANDPALRNAFDPQRLGLWGYSFGGYTALAAVGQSDRFSAAISIAAPNNLLARWGAFSPEDRARPENGLLLNWSTGTIESGQSRMGGPPWTDPDRYLRNSPFFQANRIRTPVLLVHGDQDVIPLAQSEAMFAGLYRQNKDALLATYWGEGHSFASPGNLRDFYARALAFLDEHLRGGSSSASPKARPEYAAANGGPTLPPSPPIGSRRIAAPR